MAERVVLSEMVVKVVGDTSDYQRKLNQAGQQTQNAAKNVEAAGGRMQRVFQGLGRFAGRALGPLGGVVGAAAGGGAAGGVAVAAVGLVLGELKAMIDRWHQANRIANQALESWTTGARTLRQALSDVDVSSLTQGFRDMVEAINPTQFSTHFANVRLAIQSWITGEERIDILTGRVVTQTERARAAFRALAEDPSIRRIQREAATERAAQGARDAVTELIELPSMMGLGEGPARGRRMLLDFGRAIGDVDEAARLLNPLLEQMGRAFQNVSTARVAEGNRLLEEQAARVGMLEMAQRRFEIAQRESHATGQNLAGTIARLTPELERMRVAQEQIAAGELARSLREQVAVMGLSSERAQLHRLRMQGVAESTLQAAAAEVERLEAIRRLQQPLEAVEAVDARTQEARFRVEEFRRRAEFTRQAALIAAAPAGQAGAPAERAGGQGANQRLDTTNSILRDIRTALTGRQAAAAGLQE